MDDPLILILGTPIVGYYFPLVRKSSKVLLLRARILAQEKENDV